MDSTYDAGNGVPLPVEFEEVNHEAQNGKSCGSVHPGGYVVTLEHGDVNVVVEEGGGVKQPECTNVRQDEMEKLRKELEVAQKTVSRQGLLIETAKEKITELQARILELEKEKKKIGDGDSGVNEARNKEDRMTKLEDKIEKLEKKLFQQQTLISNKEELLNEKETLLMQQEGDFNIAKTIKNAEITTLRDLLEKENKGRVNAEIQLKKLRDSKGGRTMSSTSHQGIPFNTYLDEGRLAGYAGGDDSPRDSSSEDDDVVIVDEIQNKLNKSSDWSEPLRVGSQMSNKPLLGNDLEGTCSTTFPCVLCGLVCTSNMNLIEHTQEYHMPEDEIESSDSNEMGTVQENLSNAINPPVVALRRTKRIPRPCPSMKIYNVEQTSSSPTTVYQSSTLSKANNNGMFICILCEERYPIVSKLRAHMKQAHGIEDDKFAIGCRDCGIVFPDRKKHMLHRRTAHGSTYNARRGGRARSQGYRSTTSPSQSSGLYVSKVEPGLSQELTFQITRTANGKHGVDLQRITTGFFCLCGLQFSNTKNIKIHIKRLTNNRLRKRSNRRRAAGAPAICQSNMEVDANGMRILTIESPTKTTNNSRRKIGIPGRNYHQLVGPDPREFRSKYMCSCGRVYYNRGSFQIHQRCKNNGKIFKCGWCNMSFDLHGNLKNHVRTFHKAYYGNGKFGCGNCAQTFATLALLQQHRSNSSCKNRQSMKVLRRQPVNDRV